MKNKKVLKLITLSLALVVIIAAAVGISASAETSETPSVEITLKNVAYNDVIKVMFAVDHTKAGEGAVIELLYYLEDPSVNPEATAYKGATYEKGYTDNKGTEDTSDDVTYPAFFTAGFPLARIGETVYAKAHIVDTEIYSPVVRYSVAEYLNKRLYVDDATELQDNFYASLLESAGYLQTILNTDTNENNNVENTLSETAYVYIDGNATIDGKYSSGMYALESTITPNSTDESVAMWNVEETTAEGTASRTVNNGESFNLAGTTIITPAKAEAGNYYELLGGNNFQSSIGYSAVSGVSSLYSMDDFVYYNASKGSTAATATGSRTQVITDGDDKYLLMYKHQNVNSTDMYFKKQTDATGNCIVFETDIMLSSTSVTADKTGIYLFLSSNYNNQNQNPIRNAEIAITAKAVDGAFSHYSLADGTRIDANKWYTLTMEYYTDANVVKYYIGGACFATISNFAPTSEMNYFGAFITKWDVYSVSIYFDNTVFKAINKTYVAEPAE
ncbi:MAG: hypothetical protein J6D20_05735 [Clostridia bacterium]|nr:hypothetical protein [Clostridia bacterium]